MPAPPSPTIGVVIVAYNSSDVITDCLASLSASQGVRMRVVVVDNASSDDTAAIVRSHAAQPARSVEIVPLGTMRCTPPEDFVECDGDAASESPAALTLIRSSVNGGYAHGVNLGLKHLLADASIDLFWILNPDCVVDPGAAATFARAGAAGDFSLMGGRIIFVERPDTIQTDGGTVSRWTGRCHSLNAGRPARTPAPSASALDYVSGASLVASRRFIEIEGVMRDDYFLYYEEVDWAFRRGTLPLRIAPAAVTYHRGGTAIGSGTLDRRPSAFANYFNYRSRMLFVRRFMAGRAVPAAGFALAKAARLALGGASDEAAAIVRAVFGLAAPLKVRQRLAGDKAQKGPVA